MAELSLELTADVNDQADEIQAELSNHLDVSEPAVSGYMLSGPQRAV